MPWQRDGAYTGAKLREIKIRSELGEGRRLLLKICGLAEGAKEGAARADLDRNARREGRDRKFYSQYLVAHAFPGLPYASRPGGDPDRYILFSEVNHALAEVRTLGELSARERLQGCSELVRILFRELNGLAPDSPWDLSTEAASPAEYVRAELREHLDPEAGRKHAAHIGATGSDAPGYMAIEGEDRPLPDPFRMDIGQGAVSSAQVNYLFGMSHGDMHLDNALVHCPYGKPDFASIQLIDLGAYMRSAPLSRDIAGLLLSVVAKDFCERNQNGSWRGPEETSALIDYLLAPRQPLPADLPQVFTAPLQAIHQVALEMLGARDMQAWQEQYLLSLQAQALVNTTYDDVGDHGHRFFLRLAARAADTFFTDRLERLPARTAAATPQSRTPTQPPKTPPNMLAPHPPSLNVTKTSPPTPSGQTPAPRIPQEELGSSSTTLASVVAEGAPVDVAAQPQVSPSDMQKLLGAMMVKASRLPGRINDVEAQPTLSLVAEQAQEPRKIAADLYDSFLKLPSVRWPTDRSPDQRLGYEDGYRTAKLALRNLLDGLPQDRRSALHFDDQSAALREAARRLRQALARMSVLLRS
ncbi:hypothetical protein ACGFNU_44245 [Spirillospora sp. NPDC048911]|uniref:hypothetical protein n=1 Tax=Spirillospora sp. NPDC048911 TaxID=3364527 RepID=UPI0037217702